jgi:hypothetical protein
VLGAVGLIDGDGTLRLQKDGVWQAGPDGGDPQITQASDNYNQQHNGFTELASTFLPPLVEDYGANRLLLFRDGITATRKLELLPQVATQWQNTYVGVDGWQKARDSGAKRERQPELGADLGQLS